MTTHNRFLAEWVKGAYGMELGLAPMLEQQAQRLDGDSELRKNLNLHLEKTHRHAILLRERLQRMGEDVSSVRPIDPITHVLGRVNGGKPDTARQTELFDYVTESVEVASYRALRALAEMVGDPETSRICDQILTDELAITNALHRRLPGNNGHTDTQQMSIQGNVLLAHEFIAALNAHDLDRLEGLQADGYRATLPASHAPAGRKETRARLEGLFGAFPDLRYQVSRVSANGDSVFLEWDATGTHRGPFPIMDGGAIPATQQTVNFSGVTILRLQDGKVAETKIVSDSATLMQQLGMARGGMPIAERIAERGAEQDMQRAVSPLESAERGIMYVEIPVYDRKSAERFYSGLFGWEYEHMDEPFAYTTFKSGTLEGGFAEMDNMTPEGKVTFYVRSSDIDADLRRAESLGGKIIMPRTEIPGIGWFGIVADPSGNQVGLHHANEPK